MLSGQSRHLHRRLLHLENMVPHLLSVSCFPWFPQFTLEPAAYFLCSWYQLFLDTTKEGWLSLTNLCPEKTHLGASAQRETQILTKAQKTVS